MQRIAMLLAAPFFLLAAAQRTEAATEACAKPAAPPRDALWRIVSQCLDAAAPDYCSRCFSPLEGSCPRTGACRDTTQVWAQSPRYVVIRDRKMCGCPDKFVHGLAMPRREVCGIETTRGGPDGLWTFAWKAAKARVPEDKIGLAVNPPNNRSQDQMHIHIVRLLPGARGDLKRFVPAPLPQAHLDEAWEAAKEKARAAGLGGAYGVLVIKDAGKEDGFLVFAVDGSPEKAFTLHSCQ